MNIKRFSIISLLLVFYGCSTTPEKVDLKSIPMSKEAAVQNTRGSIWPGENSRNRFFADFRARDIGDVITVTIIEKAEAKKEAKTSTSRTSSENASVTNLLGMPLNFKMSNFMDTGQPFSPTVKGGHENSFDGSGTTERKGAITATITTRVVEVLSNGNLYIEGKKETSVNNEKQHIILSGIVRPEDISSSNRVSSDVVSDLRLELSGYGVIDDKQSPGWLTRILDKIWPF
ncbi:MAG: flagellar basal body L-ring protein FlgH [Deltaproteobacteria bacterium]|nr:flagellar basal body L-ring protein FlgH [Deltaproteobacteria bacterium]